MCEPATIAMIAAAAATAVSAGSSIAGGYAQKSAADAEAENARLQGRQSLQAGNVESIQAREAAQRELGSVRAIQSARGVDLASGSSADVGGEIAQNKELEALMHLYRGRLGNWQQEYRAKVLKSQGKAAVIGGYTKAAGTILSSAATGGFFGAAAPGGAVGGGFPL